MNDMKETLNLILAVLFSIAGIVGISAGNINEGLLCVLISVIATKK